MTAGRTKGILNRERINLILNNDKFIECMRVIAEHEVDRIFCRHGMDHSIDVARIAYIINLEKQYGIEKSHIYAAALLHDIGRSKEYTTNEKHRTASVTIAENILKNCSFKEDEIKCIIKAIKSHGNSNLEEDNIFGYVLYKADKLSRNCFECNAYGECYWDEAKKNKGIII